MYQGPFPGLHNSMGAPTRDTADKLRLGEPGRSPRSARPAWWPTSAGFCWGLAAAALALTIAMVVIAVADGDFFIVPLVPGLLAAALIGGVVAARRPGHPMGTLLCGYGLVAAVAVADFAYAHAAAVHFAGSLPFGVPAMWIGSWDFVPVFAIELFILPLVFPDGRLLSRRWRPALWAAVAFVPLSVAGNAFAYQSLGSWVGNRPRTRMRFTGRCSA